MITYLLELVKNMVKPMTTNKTIKAREFVWYIKNFEYVLETLGITEPKYKARLLTLIRPSFFGH